MSTRSLSDRIWDIATKLSVPAVLAAGAAIIAHEIRISRLEATRFSRSDGLVLERDVREWMDERFPPYWLRASLVEIKADLKTIDERLRSVEQSLIKGK